MAKILLGYAYTTSITEDGTALQKPEAFKIDHNLPILLDHPDMRNAPRENKGVILSAAYDAIGCKVAVLVFDDDLAMATKGLSIAAPRKAYMTNRIGMTPIELSLCTTGDPGNPDCRILACRDATPEEITIPLKNERKATMKDVNIDPLLEKISGMQAICGKAIRELRDAGKTNKQLTEEKLANRRKLLGQDDVRGLEAKELKAFRKSMADELECKPHQIMIA